jgi:hypothetical protein
MIGEDRRSGKERRSGVDRRKFSDPNYKGPERRTGGDWRSEDIMASTSSGTTGWKILYTDWGSNS